MGRITKIQGEFMGASFQVKPTPIRFDNIIEESRQMLLDWYKEHHPRLHKNIEKDVPFEKYKTEDFEAVNSWRLDEDFRAKYCKFTAQNCMRFDREIPESVWKSDELELGTIEEAWDFFTNKRQIPSGGVAAL